MHIGPVAPLKPLAEPAPALSVDLVPPLICGPAALAHRAYAQPGLDALLAGLQRTPSTDAEHAALMLDASLAFELHFHGAEAAALQAQAIGLCQIFRVAGGFVPRSARPLRLLAVVAPGTLMVNTPLDFITAHLDVQLDLLFVRPDLALPLCLPDHDVAFSAVSESEPALLRRLQDLFRAWPRPVLNDPQAVARLSRDGLAQAFADVPGVCSPPVLRLSRSAILDYLDGSRPLPLLASPAGVLVRPVGSHAGDGLQRARSQAEIAACLAASHAMEFFVTQFVDYRSPDGLYRKARVAFIDRAPFLCHAAASEHWMVHYLNAGMSEHAERRADEARAMAEFDAGFATRHAAAFAALCDWTGLDYFQIDCAETPDGRLLLFEAAVAGIVHLMDPPDLFPYKPAQMRRVFAAFEAMLHRCAGVPAALQKSVWSAAV